MKSVYLAGPIAGLTFDEASDWRKYAKAELAKYAIRALSPMRDKDFLKHAGVLGKHGNESYALSTQKGIVTRDRRDCQSSDVVLMNLQGATAVSIGSMVEFGWADSARVPIVTVLDAQDTSNPHIHGFVKELSGYIVPTLDEALLIVASLCDARVPYTRITVYQNPDCFVED